MSTSTSSTSSRPSSSSGSSGSTRPSSACSATACSRRTRRTSATSSTSRSSPQPSYPFFHVKMEDVWVWDKNRPTRMIPRAEVYTSSDVTVEELRGEGDEPDADRGGARRAHRRAPLATTTTPSAASSEARAMLLAVDVGNTQTVFGLFDGERLTEQLPGRDRAAAAPATSSASLLGALLRPRGRRRDLPLVDGAGARSASTSAFAERWARGAAARRRAGRARPGSRSATTIRARSGPTGSSNAVAAKRALRRAVHRRRLRHLDELRRRLAGGRVRRRRARARDRDLDGRALRARRAARQGRLRRAADA